MYGYPTIRNVSISPQEDYLCVSHRAEKRWVQPLRLIAGIVAAPIIIQSAADIKSPLHRNIVFASGVGMMIWSLSVYYYANKEMGKA